MRRNIARKTVNSSKEIIEKAMASSRFNQDRCNCAHKHDTLWLCFASHRLTMRIYYVLVCVCPFIAFSPIHPSFLLTTTIAATVSSSLSLVSSLSFHIQFSTFMKFYFHNCKFLPLDRSAWLVPSSFIYFIVYSVPPK